MPKVSVVILTFNRSAMLRRAIRSVVGQTFQDFEIIIIDDCSVDDTYEVVQSFEDKRIKYLRHDVNMGEGAGRNDGVKMANGEYIAFLDDDDEWLPEKLALQVECLEMCPFEVGGIHCGQVDVNAKTGELLGTRLCDKKGNIYWELLKGNFLTLSTIMVRAKCFQFIGRFDEKIPAGLDHDMWIRVSEYFLFECINQPLVKYGVHEQKLSNNLCLQIRGKEAWIEKYAYVIKNDLPTYSKLYCELGIWYCLNGNISQGRKTILHAIKRIPWQVKPFAIFCSTFLGVEGFRKLVTLWATRKSILHFG